MSNAYVMNWIITREHVFAVVSTIVYRSPRPQSQNDNNMWFDDDDGSLHREIYESNSKPLFSMSVFLYFFATSQSHLWWPHIWSIGSYKTRLSCFMQHHKRCLSLFSHSENQLNRRLNRQCDLNVFPNFSSHIQKKFFKFFRITQLSR